MFSVHVNPLPATWAALFAIVSHHHIPCSSGAGKIIGESSRFRVRANVQLNRWLHSLCQGEGAGGFRLVMW